MVGPAPLRRVALQSYGPYWIVYGADGINIRVCSIRRPGPGPYWVVCRADGAPRGGRPSGERACTPLQPRPPSKCTPTCRRQWQPSLNRAQSTRTCTHKKRVALQSYGPYWIVYGADGGGRLRGDRACAPLQPRPLQVYANARTHMHAHACTRAHARAVGNWSLHRVGAQSTRTCTHMHTRAVGNGTAIISGGEPQYGAGGKCTTMPPSAAPVLTGGRSYREGISGGGWRGRGRVGVVAWPLSCKWSTLRGLGVWLGMAGWGRGGGHFANQPAGSAWRGYPGQAATHSSNPQVLFTVLMVWCGVVGGTERGRLTRGPPQPPMPCVPLWHVRGAPRRPVALQPQAGGPRGRGRAGGPGGRCGCAPRPTPPFLACR
jgi:hypothetical protein